MHHLEIKHLRMICAIAKSGNMTRAAQKLYVSQSALSQQLKTIESRLGVDLFHRIRKKMVLSSNGRKLLKTADQVIGLLDDAEFEIAKVAAGDSGELKVGTHCIFCFKWLPAIIANFRSHFPNIDIEIGTSHDPATELEQKRYDIIISARSLPDETYEQHSLFQDQLVCIMEKNHPLTCRKHVRLQDFHGENLISHAEKNESKFYELLLQPGGIEPKRFMTVGQPLAILELVISGLGVSVFPLWAIDSTLKRGTLAARPISRKGIPLTWRAVYMKSNNIPIHQREFIKMIQKADIINHT